MKAEEIDCTVRAAVHPPIAQPHFQPKNPELRDRDLRDFIVGGHTLVPTLDGTLKPYINLDNAASTPIARRVKSQSGRSRSNGIQPYTGAPASSRRYPRSPLNTPARP